MVQVGPDTGTVTKKVAGRDIRVPQPFVPGMPLDEDQARFLNKTFATEYVRAVREPLKEMVETDPELKEEENKRRLGEVARKFLSGFQFLPETEVQRQRRLAKDPVMKAARRQAKEMIKSHISYKLHDDPKNYDLEKMVTEFLEKNPGYIEQQRQLLQQMGGEIRGGDVAELPRTGAEHAGGVAGVISQAERPAEPGQPTPLQAGPPASENPLHPNGQDGGHDGSTAPVEQTIHPYWGTLFPAGYPTYRDDYEDELG